jgi:hypothetical protein
MAAALSRPLSRDSRFEYSEIPCNFQETFNLLVEFLEFQIEQLAPYDALLNGSSPSRIAARSALFVQAFEEGRRQCEPLLVWEFALFFHYRLRETALLTST